MSKYHCSKGHYSEYWTNARGYRICKRCHSLGLKTWRLKEANQPRDFEITYAAWLNNRISEAERIGLPHYYISGLQDARKVFINHNPLLELVI